MTKKIDTTDLGSLQAAMNEAHDTTSALKLLDDKIEQIQVQRRNEGVPIDPSIVEEMINDPDVQAEIQRRLEELVKENQND